MQPTHPLLFVNIPVADLARSRAFFTALGFRFNDHFCDDTAQCMQVNASAYYMLLTHARFAGFTTRPIVTADAGVAAMHSLSSESRAAVDTFFANAIAAGATAAGDPEDHGFMYSRAFHDLDGHRWDIFWMDPAAIPPSDA